MSASSSSSSTADIDLSAAPPEIRERLKEWISLAATEGIGAVEARLNEQNARLGSAFLDAAAAAERLLGGDGGG